MTKRLFLAGGAIVLLLVFVMRLPVSGQTTTGNADVLAALLVEVRGLRTAMEQMASAGPRVQLAMGRLQLQEQRVNTMLRRLDDLRDRLSSEEQQVSRMQQDMSRFQSAAQKATDPNMRQEMEEMAGRFKREFDLAAAQLQRLRTEHSETAANIGAEQARWVDINQRLEDLERALSRK